MKNNIISEIKKPLVVSLIIILILSLSACGSSNGKSDIKVFDKPSNNNQGNDKSYDGNDYDYDNSEENYDYDSSEEDNGYNSSEENYDYDSPDDGNNYEEPDDSDVVETIYLYFNVDSTGFFFIDTSLLEVSYNDFTKKLSYCELTPIEDWPWWGKDTEVVYATYEENTFCCLFQNRKLVAIYYDSKDDTQGEKYDTAVSYFGNPSSETEYWSGSPEYTWNMDGCCYQQHIEIYSEGDGHFRQQYVSDSFVEE